MNVRLGFKERMLRSVLPNDNCEIPYTVRYFLLENQLLTEGNSLLKFVNFDFQTIEKGIRKVISQLMTYFSKHLLFL